MDTQPHNARTLALTYTRTRFLLRQVLLERAPFAGLTDDDSDLLWRFRYRLVGDPRALGPLLRAVAWDDRGEASEGVRLLMLSSTFALASKLALYAPDLWAASEPIRFYGALCVAEAPLGDVRLFLPQLVQAVLREPDPAASRLLDVLVGRSAGDLGLATALFWLCRARGKESALQRIESALLGRLQAGDADAVAILESLDRQAGFVAQLR